MTTPNWNPRTLFRGDNLDFMRAMNSESIDLIATDPPFNKGRDFHADPESLKMSEASFQDRWTWKDDVHQDWIDQIMKQHPKVWKVIDAAKDTHSESMAAYLCFMAVRLLAMHRLLKPTGSIYLHCDTTANGYVRMLMDAIFGRTNFRNEIVWHYKGTGSPTRKFASKHDTIFFYAKSKKAYFKQVMVKAAKKSGWTGKDEKVCDSVWQINTVYQSSERSTMTDYPTQKPLPLYSRMIEASCPPYGIVLDPFAGCATTCVAAEQLQRAWVGIDLWPKVGEVVLDRLKKECGEGTILEEQVQIVDTLPIRTDDGLTTGPAFRTPRAKPKAPKGDLSNPQKIRAWLLENEGPVCQGCDRSYEWEPRHLEVDHNTPKADGGIDHISNRILLCRPCNGLKKHTLTLSGLRKENARLGYMCASGASS